MVWGQRHSGELGLGYMWSYDQVTTEALIFRAGYRYQKKNGLFVKIAITPIITPIFEFISTPITEDFGFVPWGGVAAGYAF
ncbi:hypothetical protein [Portibacter marinus]|uniref:hypothetical protein n=1 Tax=Portibacter marinus TaxID=2898660 RepID=UPI001F2608D0|nr:hypothetical protein [Portibacter marinus]